ncbi:MAG: trypsin-like peptidase domain-containing protein [Leptolyngbyaceae cyanobacterium MO_188.B28]|nr:trypsin-like peptidase domain-containing protein [Leptolyngbyaceae cyanobacterium MO_188.B28]
MFNRLVTWLFAPALLQAQLPVLANSQPTPSLKLTMHAKPSVVRLVASCTGTYYDNRRYSGRLRPWRSDKAGSGFFISPDGYIVTTSDIVKHAKDKDECKLILKRNMIESLRIDETEYNSLINEEKIVLDEESVEIYRAVILPNASSDENAKAFPFQIKEIDSSNKDFQEDFQNVAMIKIAVSNAPALIFAEDYNLGLHEPITVIGYPEADDLSFLYDDTFDIRSIVEATSTQGLTSNLNKARSDGSPIIQLDVQVGSGSVGSPVINDKGNVIGMITRQSNNLTGSFTPYAIPTNTIQELVRKSGALNKQGDTDLLYSEGLKLYWKKDFEGAKKQFQAVTSLFPYHSEANRLIHRSDQEIAKELRDNDYLLWLVMTGIAIAALGAAYLIVRSKSLKPEFAAQPISNSFEPDSFQVHSEHNQRREAIPRMITNMFRPPTMVSTQAFIELQNQQGQVRRLYLQNERNQFGREREWSDIEIPDQDWEVISRRQAVIEKEGENYRIYDGDHTRTTNGIFLNGKRIDPEEGYLLTDQDRLEIGQDTHNQVILSYFNPISSRPVTSNSQMN